MRSKKGRISWFIRNKANKFSGPYYSRSYRILDIQHRLYGIAFKGKLAGYWHLNNKDLEVFKGVCYGFK